MLREVEEELSKVDETLTTLEEEEKKLCNDANEAETKEAAQEGKVEKLMIFNSIINCIHFDLISTWNLL